MAAKWTVTAEMTRKSLPNRLTEAGIEYTTAHEPWCGTTRMVYVIGSDRLTHGEVLKKYPNV